MVVLTDLPGVTVAITIDNQPLPEHILPDLDPVERTTDRLVEAQSGQVFEIQMTADNTAQFQGSELAFQIYVDGRRIETPMISQKAVQLLNSYTEKGLGLYITKDYVKKYHFMDLVAVAEHTTSLSSRSTSMRAAISRASESEDLGITHAPSIASSTSSTASASPRSESKLTPTLTYTSNRINRPATLPPLTARESADLGTIKIEISHVNMTSPRTFIRTYASSGANFGARQALDTTKPKIGQKVGFTAPQKTEAVSTFGMDRVPDVSNPAATVIFHYRAKEAIEAFRAFLRDEGKEGVKLEEGVKMEDGVKMEEGVKMEDGVKMEEGKEEVMVKEESGTADEEAGDVDLKEEDMIKKESMDELVSNTSAAGGIPDVESALVSEAAGSKRKREDEAEPVRNSPRGEACQDIEGEKEAEIEDKDD